MHIPEKELCCEGIYRSYLERTITPNDWYDSAIHDIIEWYVHKVLQKTDITKGLVTSILIYKLIGYFHDNENDRFSEFLTDVYTSIHMRMDFDMGPISKNSCHPLFMRTFKNLKHLFHYVDRQLYGLDIIENLTETDIVSIYGSEYNGVKFVSPYEIYLHNGCEKCTEREYADDILNYITIDHNAMFDILNSNIETEEEEDEWRYFIEMSKLER